MGMDIFLTFLAVILWVWWLLVNAYVISQDAWLESQTRIIAAIMLLVGTIVATLYVYSLWS